MIKSSKRQEYLKLWSLVAICLLVLSINKLVHAQVLTSPLPQPPSGKAIGDYANVIDETTEAQLETTLTNLKTRANIELGIATVNTTGDRDIFDYSLAVARGWKIGPGSGEKNGLLLFIAVEDRKFFIQVSRHLEGDLPDGYVGAIGDRMRDPFRAGKYGEGITIAVQTLIASLADKRGFSVEGIDQDYAIKRQAPTRRTRKTSSISACGLFFIIVIIFILILSSRGGGGGCLNLLLLNSLFNTGFSSGWGNSSGSSGSSGWSDGGGFGGFGGGGDFGGGGAGGDW
jgi:uncharacterized protein